jgi:hypothetical protein
MTRTEPRWVDEFLSTVSEQPVELRFRFHCSGSALIEIPETKPTCWNCLPAYTNRAAGGVHCNAVVALLLLLFLVA